MGKPRSRLLFGNYKEKSFHPPTKFAITGAVSPARAYTNCEASAIITTSFEYVILILVRCPKLKVTSGVHRAVIVRSDNFPRQANRLLCSHKAASRPPNRHF